MTGQHQQFFVGVKGVIARDGRVLLLRKRGTRPFWDTPGGRMSPGETIRQTLQRELHEELPSLQAVTAGQLLHATTLGRMIEGNTDLALLFYSVEATFSDDDILLSDEHDAFRWVPFAEVPDVASEGIAAAVACLQQAQQDEQKAVADSLTHKEKVVL